MEKGLISVDRWGEGSQAYFLTHLHADHTRGLSPRWASGPLFCSPITAKLFSSRFPGFQLSLLRVLDVGVPQNVRLVSPVSGAEISVRVTAIDACHCPGAVMYLFQGDLGCLLYTGDFRWEFMDRRSWLAKKSLLSALGGDTVDVLHLDNSFCNPSFEFPSREIAAGQVVDIIKSHSDHDIVIGVDTLGKEELLIQVSCALNTKVWVWPERLQTMHLLGFDDFFTTKTQETRIRAIPRYSLTGDTLSALNTMHATVGIAPSGLPLHMNSYEKDSFVKLALDEGCGTRESMNMDSGHGRKQMNSSKRCNRFIYSVPYSTHSCFSEIREFMKLVMPSKVIGIVSSSFCYTNPRHFFGHLLAANLLSDEQTTSFSNTVGIVDRVDGIHTSTVSRELHTKKRNTWKTTYLRRSRVCSMRSRKYGAKIVEPDQLEPLQ